MSRFDSLIQVGNPNHNIALSATAYAELHAAMQLAMPAEVVGALVGRREYLETGAEPGSERAPEWFIIEKVVPLPLLPVGMGFAPDLRKWHELNDSLKATSSGQIAGWFYADPGINVFRPRINIAKVGEMLGEPGRMLLLCNPATNEGGLYIRYGDKPDYTSAGGFFSRQEPAGAGEPFVDIKWNGSVRGADAWLGTSSNVEPGRNTGAEDRAAFPTGAEDRAAFPQADHVYDIGITKPHAIITEPDEPPVQPQKDETPPGPQSSAHDPISFDKPVVLPTALSTGRITSKLGPLEDEVIPRPRKTKKRRPKPKRYSVPVGVAALLSLSVLLVFAASYLLLVSTPAAGTTQDPPDRPTATATLVAIEPTTEISANQSALQLTDPTATPTATDVPENTGTPTSTSTQPPADTPASVPLVQEPTAIPTDAPPAPSATPASISTEIPASSPTAEAISPAITPVPTDAGTPGFYTVKVGDTLSSIAQKYGVSASKLMRANNLAGTTITPGQRLAIPAPNTIFPTFTPAPTSPPSATPIPTFTSEPTQTPEPTSTPEATFTATAAVETSTSTPAALETATPTQDIPTPTIDPGPTLTAVTEPILPTATPISTQEPTQSPTAEVNIP